MKNSILVLLAVLLMASSVAAAPPLINFEGLLTDTGGTPVVDAIYAVKFRIWDNSVGGAIRWESSGYVPLQSTDGLIHHLLGSTNPIPDSVFATDNVWIGISVGLDPEMSPRTRLATVPFAFWANKADTAVVALNKTVDAGEIVVGTLSTARYSAYLDLLSEARLGNNTGQVAPGNHVHQAQSIKGAMARYEDTTIVTLSIVPMQPGALKTFTVAPGQINDFLRLTFAFDASPNGTFSGYVITVFANGQSLGDPVMGEPGFVATKSHLMEVTAARLTGNQWNARSTMTDVSGSLPEKTDGNVATIDVTGGVTFTIWASVSPGGPTTQFTVGKVIVEYDVD